MIQSKPLLTVAILTLIGATLPSTAASPDQDSATPESQRAKAVAEKLTYKLDKSHSSIAFRIKHFDVGYVYGLFRLGRGQFHLDPNNLDGSFIEVSVKADSVNTNHGKRDEHLKNPDFFNVEKYTEISFKSTKISYAGDDKFSVDGNLTFLGVTRPLTANMIDMGSTWMDHASAYQRGMTTTITVDRTKFGMKSEHYLSDEVDVFISLEGGAKPEQEKPDDTQSPEKKPK